MADSTSNDVREQVALIERMMREGRRTTEYWGWAFVLWGVAYLVAIGWSYAPHAGLAWPVTMIGAALLTVAISSAKRRNQPPTTVGRSIGGVWVAVSVSLFIFCFCSAFSGHYEAHTSAAAVEAFLGAANLASGIILRWKIQQAIAAMWWVAAAATFFLDMQGILIVLVVSILLGNIAFGVYLMIRETRDKARIRAGQVLHA
jgi:hypothetical protein